MPLCHCVCVFRVLLFTVSCQGCSCHHAGVSGVLLSLVTCQKCYRHHTSVSVFTVPLCRYAGSIVVPLCRCVTSATVICCSSCVRQGSYCVVNSVDVSKVLLCRASAQRVIVSSCHCGSDVLPHYASLCRCVKGVAVSFWQSVRSATVPLYRRSGTVPDTGGGVPELTAGLHVPLAVMRLPETGECHVIVKFVALWTRCLRVWASRYQVCQMSHQSRDAVRSAVSVVSY